MIKPLLRTIPTMSGNVKLACNVIDYKDVGGNTYEADIRYAKILPISSTLYQRKIETQLLGSSWEYDLKKFYDIYNDVFFEPYFKYNTEEILKINKTVKQSVRNTDFEMGAKRVSYIKNGMQYAFFAPFYFEGENDLPAYFELHVNIRTTVHSVKKTIRINIMNNSSSKGNHLCHYLSKYAKGVDSNVCFMLPNSKQAAYYGIDLVHGGFVKSVDNGISNLYNIQTTINNFDATICTGFRRNKIAMKQIMPLAFYFNVRDIMTESELKLYRNAAIEFSGYYVSQGSISLPWYDFNVDYDYWKESVLRLNNSNGIMQWFHGSCENLMDVSFPSLNDTRYIKYQFSNRLTSTYCRWKLKYSDDEHPYITNISPAFSKNQDSNYKYGQYPVSFSSMDGLALPITDSLGKSYYNLIFPLSTNTHYYDLYNSNSTLKYRNILNNYCLNWFNSIEKVDDELFHTPVYWKDVVDNCVYYNGILYDLTNIYSELVDPIKIDKFGVFVKVNHNFMTEGEIAKLKFVDYTLNRQVASLNNTVNALSNLQLLNWSIGDKSLEYKNFLYNNEEYRGNQQHVGNRDLIQFNKIFTYSENNTGHYIDFADYGMDYYELNKYYDYESTSAYINDMRENFFTRYKDLFEYTYATDYDSTFPDIIKNQNLMSYMGVFNSPSSYMINSYELLPIYCSYDISYFDGEFDANDRNDYMYAYGSSKMLNLNQYEAYTWSMPMPDGSIDTYTSYHYIPIEGKYDVYGNLEPGTDAEFSYVGTYLHVSNMDEYAVKKPSLVSYINTTTKFTTTYFSSGKHEYIQTTNGNTFYNWRTFIKGSYIGKLTGEPYAQTYLKTFCEFGTYQDKYQYSQINEEGTSAYKLWKTCQHVQAIAADMLATYLSTKHQYLFNPVIQTNGTIYASNIFTECFTNTGKFYGSNITYSQLPNDKDVIYADRYNLNAIFKKYTGIHTYTYSFDKINDDGTTSKLTAADPYWYTSEKVYNHQTQTFDTTYVHYSNIPERVTYNYSNDGTVDYFKINDNDYATFYAKFLNKQHIYYWYGELAKDEQLKYPENWPIDWKKNIFVKRRVLAHTEDGLKVKDEYIELVKAGYMFAKRVNPDWFLSFKQFYAHINESEEGLFFFDGCEGEKFELVYKDIFFRVNKTLWDIINCEENLKFEKKVWDEKTLSYNTVYEPWYKDIYLYRIEKPEEYSKYRTNDVHMRFVGHNFWNTYQGYYSDPDCALTPLFYNIFEKAASEEAIAANYQLHNISPVEYTWDEYDERGEEVIKTHYGYNYRYNANDSLYMTNITDEEREELGITKTWDEYTYCGSGFSIETNDLDYNENLFMSTYTDPHNGLNYGFYVINASVDNTSNSWRIDGQTSMSSKSLTEEKYDYLNNIKSIQYVNGVKMSGEDGNPEYVTKIFKNIAPFLNLNLLSNLNHISTVIKPGSFNIDMIYNQQLVDNTNNSTEINIYKNEKSKYTKQNLYRYTHNIVPYITERKVMSNVYYLKLKNVDKTILEDGVYNSIGDSPLYTKTIQIDSFTPHNVYTLSENEKEVKSYNNIDYKYTPLEYKHFNASKLINLEPEITIRMDGRYTYDELVALQTEEQVIDVFRGYINTGRLSKFDDNEILFLYKKYKVEYDSKSIGLNYNRTIKLYSLTYKFSLL